MSSIPLHATSSLASQTFPDVLGHAIIEIAVPKDGGAVRHFHPRSKAFVLNEHTEQHML